MCNHRSSTTTPTVCSRSATQCVCSERRGAQTAHPAAPDAQPYNWAAPPTVEAGVVLYVSRGMNEAGDGQASDGSVELFLAVFREAPMPRPAVGYGSVRQLEASRSRTARRPCKDAGETGAGRLRGPSGSRDVGLRNLAVLKGAPGWGSTAVGRAGRGGICQTFCQGAMSSFLPRGHRCRQLTTPPEDACSPTRPIPPPPTA